MVVSCSTHSQVTMLHWRGLCVGFIALGKGYRSTRFTFGLSFKGAALGARPCAMRKPKGTSFGFGCLNVTAEPRFLSQLGL